MTGRPKALLELASDETEQLERWVRRRKSSQALALRSRIVLACATGWTNKEWLRGCASGATVGKWRSRFVMSDWMVWSTSRGRGATDDHGRTGRGRRRRHAGVDPGKRHALVTGEDGRRSGLSKSTIGRIWSWFGLKPHRADGFKLSNDPLFVEKIYDVVGLYLRPPECSVVFCVEKSQVQALGRSQPAFPMMPGMPEQRTHDYVRNGTTSLFAAFNTATGRSYPACTADTAPSSSRSSSPRSTRKSPHTWTCT